MLQAVWIPDAANERSDRILSNQLLPAGADEIRSRPTLPELAQQTASKSRNIYRTGEVQSE